MNGCSSVLSGINFLKEINTNIYLLYLKYFKLKIFLNSIKHKNVPKKPEKMRRAKFRRNLPKTILKASTSIVMPKPKRLEKRGIKKVASKNAKTSQTTPRGSPSSTTWQNQYIKLISPITSKAWN